MTAEKSQEKIYVAGHRGMVGSAIARTLLTQGVAQSNIVTRTHSELDLCNQNAVNDFFAKEQPTQVYLAAAKVGGIHSDNTYPADFIYQNLMVQSNVIHAAHLNGVRKLLFLGSSCIYPQLAIQPMSENALLTGPLEPTNEPYAVAKIAGIKICESYNRQYGRDYRCVMPTNLYGPGDSYHAENSHVIPALIRRFHIAKVNKSSQVTIWGTGKPRREFLFVDDMAAASVYVMNLDKYTYLEHTETRQSHINVGFGSDVTIIELADEVCKVVGYQGQIVFDSTKPVGPPQKLLDSSLINSLGWRAKTGLQDGLVKAYADFCNKKLNAI